MSLQSFVGKNTEKVSKKVMRGLEKRAQKALDYWYDYLDWKMSEPKHGRQYTKKILGVTYTWVASRPGDYPGEGEFPYNLTGRTIDSIHKFVSVGPKQVRLYLKVGDAKTPYVEWLQKVRPFLKESQRDIKDELLRILLEG